MAQFAFKGMAPGDNIKSANALASSSNGSTTGEFRLVDVLSGLVAISGTTGNGTITTAARTSVVSNLPSTPKALVRAHGHQLARPAQGQMLRGL